LLWPYSQARGFRGGVLGGWTLSSNQTYASGNPFSVTAGYDYNADGVTADRPILLDQAVFGRSVDNPRVNPATGQPISTGQLPLSAFFPTVATATSARPFDPAGVQGIDRAEYVFRAGAVECGRRHVQIVPRA